MGTLLVATMVPLISLLIVSKKERERAEKAKSSKKVELAKKGGLVNA